MNLLLLANEPAPLFVVGLGIGTVFVGLICIIGICYLTGFAVKLFEKPKDTQTSEAQEEEPIKNRGEFIAAVAAAIAEESGTDASGIRIVSVKKL